MRDRIVTKYCNFT